MRLLISFCVEKNYDVIILGAGAAGLMCAIEAGKRGPAASSSSSAPTASARKS